MTAPKNAPAVEAAGEPPSKKPRRSLGGYETAETNGEGRRVPQTPAAKKQNNEPLPAGTATKRQTRTTRSSKPETQSRVQDICENPEDEESEMYTAEGVGEMNEDDVASIAGDADGYESPAEPAIELQNFPLSKIRLSKSNIVYSDDSTLCIRIKEKTVCNCRFSSREPR